MDEERRRILEMLEQGKISAAEADELLSALEAPSRKEEFVGLGGERTPRIHIRITDTNSGRVKTDVVIPTGMLGRKWAKRLHHLFAGHAHMGPPQMQGLEEAARFGTKGTIVDVSDDSRGERVEIVME